jgi:hypothetical protein
MKRLLCWIGLTLGGLVALGIIAYGVVHVLSERALRRVVALGGRNLVTMGPWARGPLSQLNDVEVSALYSYLHTMP